MQIQFRLRTAFVLLTGVAIVSELFRAATSGNSPFFTAVTLFGVGGIAGIAATLFGSTLGIMTTREPAVQQIAFVAAGVFGTVLWIFVVHIGTVLPLSLVSTTLAVVVMFLGIRSELATVETGQHEQTMQRLLETKSGVRAELEKTKRSRTDARK